MRNRLGTLAITVIAGWMSSPAHAADMDHHHHDGRAMNMSYKRAWDLVDEINRICRRSAVERQAGGKNGGGAVLTPFGLSLVARYRKIERSAESAARKELRALRAEMGARRKA